MSSNMCSGIIHDFLVIELNLCGHGKQSFLDKLKSFFHRFDAVVVFIILEHSFTLLALVNSILAQLLVLIKVSTIHLLFAAEVSTLDNAEHAGHIMVLDILVLKNFFTTLI
uniref:Uncharacterized protein n=1 Tax=Strombidinopsis acuminata TaxID=141414 RepID=A0A7S3W3L6_9SPIT